MFAGVKLTYMGLGMVISGKLLTMISIMVGGLIYIVVLLGIGGISKEEILAMPKGDKLFGKLKKLKLVR